jgi:integrase
MISDVKKSEDELMNQSKTEKQEKNWLPYDDVKNMQTHYEKLAMDILSTKGKIDETKKEILAKYMVLTLSSGVYFGPRRSEMVLIKVKDVDQKKDNYIDLSTNEFVYNQYKTAKKYGQQRVKFPSAFKAILKKYLSKITGQTYLLEHMGLPYDTTRITRTLNQIFGRKISTSMLRHIYLTNHYEGIPALKEMNQLAQDMGQSVGVALQYIKH